MNLVGDGATIAQMSAIVRQHYMREIGAAMPTDSNLVNAQQNLGSSKGARPVLGAQPAPPGTTPFRYVRDMEDSGPSMELVPLGPYYKEDSASMQLAISQLTRFGLINSTTSSTSFVHVSQWGV